MKINDINDQFNKYGIVKVKNFLDQDEIKKFKESIIKFGKPKKGTKKSIIFYEKMNFLNKVRNLSNIFSYKNFAKSKNLTPIANELFGSKSNLYYIDTYFSEINNSPVLDWHFDQAYSGRENVKKSELLNPNSAAIKFFIYLSKTFSDNGCLSYIKGSNKIAYCLKKMIYKNIIPYKPYWKLNQFINLLNDKSCYINLENELGKNFIDEFLKNAQIANNETNHDHDFQCETGDMLIFDEAGCHRGSKILYSDRYVLRFLFKREKVENC
tara:strand:- start:120 stop:923 length:804 start_codon:yes stop_codon:yes gene_type:complete